MRQKQKFGQFLGFTFNICESRWLSTNFDSHRFYKLFLSTTSLDYFQTWKNCTFCEGNYLATRGPDLEPFVVGFLIQLLCRVTKFGWLEDDRFKKAIKEAMNVLSQVMIFFFSFLDFFFNFIFWVLFYYYFFLSSLFFKSIVSTKYILLSSPMAYLFPRCVRLFVLDFLYNNILVTLLLWYFVIIIIVINNCMHWLVYVFWVDNNYLCNW